MILEKVIIFSFIVIFLLIEFRLPARAYQFFSRQRKEDLAWLIINQIAYPVFMLLITYQLGSYLSGYIAIKDLSKEHILIQFVCLLLITDFASYWAHRSFHRIKPLWEFHRLHHSTTELTVLSSFRHNWIDFFIQSTILGFSTGLLTVDPKIRLAVDSVFSVVCIIQHTNIRIRYPAFFEYLVITPKNHLWHHSKELKRPFGQNFGFLFPWWDMIFKTLYNPEHQDTELGLSDDFSYSSFANKIFHPLDKWFRFK